MFSLLNRSSRRVMTKRKTKPLSTNGCSENPRREKALWGSKKGRTGINTLKEGNFKVIENVDDGFKLVDFAHDNSHFAKTGKNPESSRGHTVYVLILKIKNPQGEDYDPVQTEFVVVDLAGSEGGSTLDALPDGPDKTARFLEGGVINFGLTSLKDMFAEMRKKGKLKASEGNGLRKLLYPFVTSNTMMSIVFTLSPSITNIMATRATMKFAADACKLKMKPIADTGKKNWQKLYQKLEKQLIEKNALIKELQEHMNDGAAIAAEHEGSGSASGPGSGELYEKFTKMFEANADRMYGMVHDAGIDSLLSDEVMDAVQKSLTAKKDDYIDRIKAIYEKHDPNYDVSNVPALVQQSIDKGMGLQNYYEQVAHQFDATVEAEVRRDTLLTPTQAAAAGNQRRNTGLWMEKAQLLREKTANLASIHDDTIKEMKAELAEVKEEDETDYSVEMAVEEAEYEEIDHSAPPFWFVELDDTTQIQIEEKISGAMDEKGKLSPEISNEIMTELEIDATQMDDLRTYMLIRRGAEHDADTIHAFQSELGDTESMNVKDMGSDELTQILDLRTKIHQLENEKRVERTMKLWGNMRLRIRDRKLKAKEKQVETLHTEKTQLSRHLSERTYALEEKKKEIQRAADELSHMKTAFDVLKRQDHETMQAMSNTLTEEKATLDEIKTTLMKEHEELKVENDAMSKEMMGLKEEKAKMEAELEVLRKQVENNEEMDELKEIERVLAEVRKESKNSLGETTRVLNEMREDMMRKYEEKISDLQKDNASKMTEVEKSKNDLMELEYKLKAKDAKIEEMQNSTQSMEAIRGEYEKVNDRLLKAKESVEGELEAKNGQMAEMQKKLTSLEAERQALEAAQTSRVERATKRELDAETSADEMQNIITTLREKCSRLMSQEGDLKQDLGEARGKLEAKEQLLEDTQERYKKAMDDLNTLQDEVKEMHTLRNDLYARDADLTKRNQQVAKLEDKVDQLEDELGASRRRESAVDMNASQNFDQLKEMLEKSMEKMNNESSIVEKIEEVMKSSDLNTKFEEALKENGDLKADLGRLRGELMIKDQQLETLKGKEEMAEKPKERGSNEEDQRAIALMQQQIKSLEQQLEQTKERLEKEKSEKNMCKGRLEEMEQAKAALEAHIKTLQEQLASRGVEPVAKDSASAADLERALQDLEDTNRKYLQSLEDLGNLKGQLATKDALLEDMKTRSAGESSGGELAAQIADLRRDLLSQKTVDDQTHKIFQLENEVKTLEATIEIKDREINDVRKEMMEKANSGPSSIEVERQLSDKDTEIELMEERIQRLTRDMERKDEMMNELQDTIAALDHQDQDRFQAERNAKVERDLNRQIEDLQDENQRLHRDLESSYQMNTNVGQIDELRNTAAAAIAKQNALEAAIAAKNDEIQRANAEIQKLKLEISGLQNQINYERKKMAEVGKQREERLQHLVIDQCQAIRNQLNDMADSAGLQVTPTFLEPLQRDIKRMSSILSSNQHREHATRTTTIINGGGHTTHMENVDYGKTITDQIASQRARCRELEDQAALKNAKINQLENSMENMKVLHQKEMDEQELAYLLEMRKMREIVRKLRQLSPKVRRFPEIEHLDRDDGGNNGGFNGRGSGSLGGYTSKNLRNRNRTTSDIESTSKFESTKPTAKHARYKSADSSRYNKKSRSRDAER